ncbi:helix-turn-helix transcriptional regulator [Streptacidiphilus fuscans]|uniref:Response regulator transcription factor n=1 Tax=Streptacidiphilus fuscans TaxID=2789292 RepID=A0A931FIQ2_9ACTN|nr:LuxR C-terminal-related transcriptional regulator [Streptacidiphilus fuscans]MBF9073146.1 response regulator transcription factor [Streptacidiphilus fuscans]
MSASLDTAEAVVPVVVYASDPISSVGARGQLIGQSTVEVVDAAGCPPGTVAVVLTESLDEATVRRLRQLRADGTRVVLVAALLREAELLRVIECGVGTIVWRHEATGAQLRRAVLAASRGDGDMPSDLLGKLVAQVGALRRSGPDHLAAPAAGLAPREVDVLRLVAEGLDTAEIASRLSYSERTIKNLIYGLTNRLRLRNRAHAVAYALREGYF